MESERKKNKEIPLHILHIHLIIYLVMKTRVSEMHVDIRGRWFL